MICEVIVDIAHSEVDKIFDYVCDFPVEAGTRVTVPFGRTTVTGFVMRVKEHSEYPSEKLRKIYRGDDYPALNTECLALSRKIAERYRCPLALTLRLFLPSEMRTGKVAERYRSYIRIADGAYEPPARAAAQTALLAYLDEKGEEEAPVLREKLGAGGRKTADFTRSLPRGHGRRRAYAHARATGGGRKSFFDAENGDASARRHG